MAGGGGGVGGNEEGGSRERVRGSPFVYVLALPAMALHAVVSRLEAAVPRRARSCLPRAVPSAWWSYRIPVLAPPPPPLAEDTVAEEEEGRRSPRPQRVLVARSPDPAVAAAAAEKPAKRARRCLQCHAAETPQWRSGPMGRGTLCNACGVWYGRALPEHRPAARPIADPTPDNPIWEPAVPGAIYLVRKTAKQRRPPRTEATPAPSPPPRPATSCLHCGSSEPPIWREGPIGRREVCTACGARYKKGRPLPECRPAASPAADSPLESPVWEPQAPPRSAVYLARKPAKKGRAAKRGKPAKQARPPIKKRRSCLHCGSSETPQWREGPQGRGTLCNACGVRYKQGRLLPEYRPMASPTFVPSEHANTHRRVLQLHRQRQGKDQHPPPPPPPPPHTGSAINLPPVRDDHPTAAPGSADKHQVAAPYCTDEHHVDGAPSSLNSLLLDGPSAPLIEESDEFVIS